MTAAFGQLERRRPRVAAWFVAGACALLGSALGGQNSPTDGVSSVPSHAPASRTPKRAFAGTVTGRVTDARTGGPVGAAAVEVDGTRLGTSTSDDGRYRFTGVPAGSRVIIVRRLGYAAARQTVTVTDDQQVTADFTLQAAAISLDQVVVTGTAGGEQRRSIGNAV